MTSGRAVFDTNVMVSGLLSPHGSPGRIVEWLRQDDMRAVVDDRILSEYVEVLHRPELRIPTFDVETLLAAVLASAEFVDVASHDTIQGLPDPTDAPFLECAVKSGCVLVTGNARHFPARHRQGVRVLTPAEFVRELIAN